MGSSIGLIFGGVALPLPPTLKKKRVPHRAGLEWRYEAGQNHPVFVWNCRRVQFFLGHNKKRGMKISEGNHKKFPLKKNEEYIPYICIKKYHQIPP